ncbi:hypothetical protein [Microbacterium sp. NPDC058389]|uniref:hypothetical protein n=1 Tax=Microbacterium sp. NPDC058389 TaxID=3346475 RepID=UPI00364A8188
MSVVAKLQTKCPECHGTIDLGDFIEQRPVDGDQRWVHAHCPPGRLDIVRPVCPGCWTEKAVDGSCLCGDAA